MNAFRLFLALILTITLVSCSPAARATHERVGYSSDLKSLNVSALESAELKSALAGLGVNTATAEKLAEPRADAAKEIFVIASKNAENDAPRLVLAAAHTNVGVLFSVDAIWNELPADRYLDVLGIYFNIDLSLNYPSFTDAWISYGGKTSEMKAETDYELLNGDERAIAMKYDLGALTKGMKKGKGPLVIHFDVYGMTKQGEFNYNLWAYYDHGTGGYDKDVKVNKSSSNMNWQFDIKDGSEMSAVFYEMPCPSLLAYKNK